MLESELRGGAQRPSSRPTCNPLLLLFKSSQVKSLSVQHNARTHSGPPSTGATIPFASRSTQRAQLHVAANAWTEAWPWCGGGTRHGVAGTVISRTQSPHTPRSLHRERNLLRAFSRFGVRKDRRGCGSVSQSVISRSRPAVPVAGWGVRAVEDRNSG